MRVLLVEDERRMAALLQQGLTEEGIHVFVAHEGHAGLSAAQASSFDVILLDVQLPGIDGLSIARRLRSEGNHTPILLLTSRDSERDIVAGFQLGADDYVTKPFSFEVLLARMRALCRRGPAAQPVCYQVLDLTLNTETRIVARDGKSIRLTKREYSLLELLIRNAGKPVTRDAILETVWGFHNDVEENTVEAFVKLLRQKVDAPFPVKLISTIRGIGYCLRLPEQ